MLIAAFTIVGRLFAMFTEAIIPILLHLGYTTPVLGLYRLHDDAQLQSGWCMCCSVTNAWAARYNTWLLIKLTPKGMVFFFL